jgi:hypothetical protein
MKLIRLAKRQPRIQRTQLENRVPKQAMGSSQRGRCDDVAQKPSSLKQEDLRAGELCEVTLVAKVIEGYEVKTQAPVQVSLSSGGMITSD